MIDWFKIKSRLSSYSGSCLVLAIFQFQTREQQRCENDHFDADSQNKFIWKLLYIIMTYRNASAQIPHSDIFFMFETRSVER